MDIQQDILLKHAVQATLEQLTSEYQQKGYEVTVDPDIDGIQADLMVVKEPDVIVFELKAGKWNEAKRQAVRQLRHKAVHGLGAKFKLVLVNLPQSSDIYIDGLENLFTELLPTYYADAFSRLATHAWVDEVDNIKINDLSLKRDHIAVSGSALVTLRRQYGSNGDVKKDLGLRVTESFPLYFHLVLDNQLELKEVVELELDGLEDVL